MQLVKPSIEFLNMIENPLQALELAGRTCYKSEDKITEDSAEDFVKMPIKRGHEAMIEHASASYKIVCDRGVTHEIVRHRLFSYAQESSRYCNYKGGVTFILPCWLPELKEAEVTGRHDKVLAYPNIDQLYGKDMGWLNAMLDAESKYLAMVGNGWSPQQARSVLPNSLKTEIVVTGNLREWRHFFKLRCAKAAHPQMQEVANMVLVDMKSRVPVIFDDLE